MRPIVGAVCILMLFMGTALAKPRLIASSVDAGTLPVATADGTVNNPARGPLVVVKASPPEPVEISASIRCYRGSHNRGMDYELDRIEPPLHRRFALPMKHADYCSVDAFASYAEVEDENGNLVEGRISLRIYR
jgi:hypothetical protein